MIKIKDVLLIKEAVNDLNDGKIFYSREEAGVGNYFWDSLIAVLPMRRDPAWIKSQFGPRS